MIFSDVDEDGDGGLKKGKGWAGGCRQGRRNDELSPRVFGVTPQTPLIFDKLHATSQKGWRSARLHKSRNLRTFFIKQTPLPIALWNIVTPDGKSHRHSINLTAIWRTFFSHKSGTIHFLCNFHWEPAATFILFQQEQQSSTCDWLMVCKMCKLPCWIFHPLLVITLETFVIWERWPCAAFICTACSNSSKFHGGLIWIQAQLNVELTILLTLHMQSLKAIFDDVKRFVRQFL